MSERQPPKDDHEIEQMTGIRPADHAFTTASPDTIAKMERAILGPGWFRRRKKEQDADRV